jgi:hypothetical protein
MHQSKIITPVRALPKIAPIIQAKRSSRLLLVIARAPSLKIKSVSHRTNLNNRSPYLRITWSFVSAALSLRDIRPASP